MTDQLMISEDNDIVFKGNMRIRTDNEHDQLKDVLMDFLNNKLDPNKPVKIHTSSVTYFNSTAISLLSIFLSKLYATHPSLGVILYGDDKKQFQKMMYKNLTSFNRNLELEWVRIT